jgi:hypothetical protein
MQTRKVTEVSVNNHGYVTELWNDTENWSPRSTVDAVTDLELGTYSYYCGGGGEFPEITDAWDERGKYLTTIGHDDGTNELLELPRRDSTAA